MSKKKSPASEGYPSDISAEQFKEIKPLEVDLHSVFNAVLYVLKEGCRWRAVAHDFPKWSTAFSFLARWARSG